MMPVKSAVSSTSTTSSNQKRDPKWTVMVFMGADTIEGNEPLDTPALDDIREIESFSGARFLDVFVQVNHTAKGTTRSHFGWDPGSEKRTRTDREIPKGQPEESLISFIEESVRESGHRREDHSMLVLWGHAYDFAFARSRTREGVVDAIDFVELSGLLQRLQDRLKIVYQREYADPSEERPTLDIIGFDACDVATVEMACQLQPFAKYLLASEIGIPIPGWPYDRILDRLGDPKGRLMAPAEFGSYVVRRFCESYPAATPVSLTFLDLRQAPKLREHARYLALALGVAIADADVRERVTALFGRSQTDEDRPYVDVIDLCLSLVRENVDPFVTAVAKALGDLLLSPGDSVVNKSEIGGGRPLIIDHGRNAIELARLNGISLYAPHLGANDGDAVRGLYERFVFAQDTFWSRLVHALAK